MAQWHESLTVWGPAWAAVRDLEGTADGAAVRVAGGVPELLLAWPGDAELQDIELPDAERQDVELQDAGVIHLATGDATAARRFAASRGLRETGALALLSALTDDLDLVPSLPEDANIAEAPLENYDAVEIALFDRPVAEGRIRLGDGLAVLAGLKVDDGHDELVGVFEQAMVATLGEEAFLHGADVLYLVADAAQAARFAALDGWSQVAEIISFTR